MKTKSLVIAILMLLNIGICTAQDTKSTITDNSPTGFIAFNLGSALPLEAYGSTINANSSGYAQSGYDVNISEGVCIKHSNFGIAFKVDLFANGFNMQSYVNNTPPDGIYSWESYNSNGYSGQTALVGLYGTIPLHKFAIDYRVMGGLMLATYPYQSMTEINPNGFTIQYSWSACSSSAFGYDVGFGLRWNASRHICFMMDYDYMSGMPSFSDNWSSVVSDMNGNVVQTGTRPNSFKQDISVFDITFGFGWIIR